MGSPHPTRGSEKSCKSLWEGLGSLVRGGHLDAKLYWDSVGNFCQRSWVTLEPFIQQQRAEVDPQIGEHFEWLAEKMDSLDRLSGSVTVIDQAFVANHRVAEIAGLEERLQVEESLRSVSAASSETSRFAPAAAPSPAAVTES